MTGYARDYEPFPHDLAEQAACRGLGEVMHGVRAPTRKGGTNWSQARAICASCPITAECLAHAIAQNENEGMWGGKTPTERAVDTRTCPECGTQFANRRLTTCSPECAHESRKRQRTA